MRIAIIASGTRGDVEPYVALGKGLQQAGHVVRLVTHANFEPLIRSHGVEFWPVAGDVQDVAQGMTGQLERGNFVAILREMSKQAEIGAISLAQSALAACRGMDLVLGGLAGLFVGFAIAQKLGLPYMQAYYAPFTPTRAFPSFLVRKQPPLLGGAFNRLSYHLARQMMWQSFRSADNRARKEVLALPPAPFSGPYSDPRLRECPVLYGYSPSVIPPPDDWGQDIHVTGYWFLDEPAEWTPPPGLARFLKAGPLPVYVGFGSMSTRDPQATARLIFDALARAGQRGIVLSGWGGMVAADAPNNIYMLDTAPFAWLFPRMAAVVHHGGAGTTAAGLRAGVPSIVVPFFADQPFWGQRVAALGAGPQPIPRKQLTAERLAAAVTQAVSNPQMRSRAADLGAKIRAEDGIGCATKVIAEWGKRRAKAVR
jgi:sterol 3beta-glucosyltransferase